MEPSSSLSWIELKVWGATVARARSTDCWTGGSCTHLWESAEGFLKYEAGPDQHV